MSKNVFLWNGQGNHYFLMGKELYESTPSFKKWLDKTDTVFSRLTGNFLISILYRSNQTKADSFSAPRDIHPALFCIEYTIGMILEEVGIHADIVVGVSPRKFIFFHKKIVKLITCAIM